MGRRTQAWEEAEGREDGDEERKDDRISKCGGHGKVSASVDSGSQRD